MAKVDNLTKAKAALVIHQPFFATILMKMPFVEKNDMPMKTMATDGRNIYYDKDFVESKSVDELKFVVCHEVLHVAHEHMTRRASRQPQRWNYAADYMVNDVLVDCEVGLMPEGALLNKGLVQAGKTTEGVYNLLPEQDGGGGGGGGGGEPYQGNGEGQPFDDHLEPNMTEAERAELSQDIKEMVASAAQTAKMIGKMPSALDKFVDTLLKGDHDWEKKLREFMTTPAKVDRSYARPKRRFAWSDIYLPTMTGTCLDQVVIAVDNSGSCSDEDQRWFGGTINAIKQETRPKNMDVLFFTTEVTHHDHYDDYDELTDFARHGSGGTCVAPIFDRIEEDGWRPDCLIVLTDLYIDDFPPVPPDYPVMWVSTSQETDAPFGEVVRMHNER